MPLDPKRTLRSIRAQKLAQQNAANLTAKQKKRRAQQPPGNTELPESEAAQWVRDNLTWDQHFDVWEMPYTISGDYCGDYVNKANATYLMATHPDLFQLARGSHGSEVVGITEEKRLALTDEEWETIKEIVEGLEDYPIIDEDTHSNIEMEAKWEYWTEYGRDGVREDLVKKFSDDFIAQLAVCMKTDEFWDEMMREKDWDQYINEEGSGLNMYMRTEDVVARGREGVTVDEVMPEGGEAEVIAYLDAKFEKEHLEEWVQKLQQYSVYLNDNVEAFAVWKEAQRQIGVENLWKIDRPDMQKEPGEAIELESGALDEAAKLVATTPTDDILRKIQANRVDPNQLNFKFESKRLIEALLQEQDVYRLSTTQIDLPKDLADHIVKWGRIQIKDDDLYYDKDGGCGRESEQHITVLYGLKDSEPSEELKKIVRDTKPFEVRLGNVTLFENEEFDVVKVEVHSDALVTLSNAIRAACPNENKYPDYIPHCTIAYVKKGRAEKLKEEILFTTESPIEPEFQATELLFKGAGAKDDPNRKIVTLAFNRMKNEAVERTADGKPFHGATHYERCGHTNRCRCSCDGERTVEGNCPACEMGLTRKHENAKSIIEAIDPKRFLRERDPVAALAAWIKGRAPGQIRLSGNTQMGFKLTVVSDGAREMKTFGTFTHDQIDQLLMGYPEINDAEWTLEAAPDAKRVLRDVEAAADAQKTWYAYVPRKYGPVWLTRSGLGSEVPVTFTDDERRHRLTLAHWNEVLWTDDPKKTRRLGEAQEEVPTPAEINKAAAKTDPDPSEEEKENGDYKKGHIEIHGFDIAIENAKGSERSGTDKDGKPWSVTMPAVYGEICGTKGKDKDHLDVYIGPNPDSDKVFIVNQAKKEGGFDEHKIMLGFPNKFRAIRCYDKAFSNGLGPQLRDEVIETTVQGLKDWVKNGDTTKPFQLPHSPEADWLDDSIEEGLDESLDPKGALQAMKHPRRTIKRPTYFKYVPNGFFFRTASGRLILKDEERDPERIANAYSQDDEFKQQLSLAPDVQCFPMTWRSANVTNPASYRMSDRVKPDFLTPEEAEPQTESRFPFDMLNFPTDASVLVSKLLDLDNARPKPVL